MNICIGGPWHRSRLLAPRKYEKMFKVKANSFKTSSTYFKRRVKVENTVYIFWVSDEIIDLEAFDLISKYFEGKSIFIY